MNKIYTLSLNFLIVNALISKPAFADSDVLKKVSNASLSVASMTTGTIIGTPIAIVRKTCSQYVDCIKEFKKDSNTYKFWGAGCSVPVAVVAGLVKGTTCGAQDAIRYSVNKPFSKDAFSLGKLDDNTTSNTTVKPSNTDKPESQPWGKSR